MTSIPNSLLELGGRVVELRLKLDAEETNTCRLARDFGLAYLQSTHGEKLEDPDTSMSLARALLASMTEANA